MNAYELLETIGNGSCGTVYNATRKCDGERVAIKIVPKPPDNDDDAVSEEVSFLCQCQNVPGVIRVYEHFAHANGDEIIVMEKPQNCVDLFDYISENAPLAENEAKNIFVSCSRH